ncbi:MAG: DMT family transporter [Spirosomataceae bacterium]
MQNTIKVDGDTQKWVSWGLLLFLAVIWGLSFIMIKRTVTTFTSVEVGAARIFIAGLALSPWALRKVKSFPKKEAPYLALSGLFGYLIPAFIFAFIGSKINSSLAGTLNATTPVFVLVVGALFFQQAIIKNQVLGITLGFAGSLILVLSGNDGQLNFDNPYALLALGATIMYGFNGNIIGKYLRNLAPMQVSAWSLLFVGTIAFFILLTTDFFYKVSLPQNQQTVVYLLILGVINSGFAAVVFNYVIQMSSPVFASSVTYLIPVVAMIVGLLDGEIIALSHYIGMAVILVGVYLINKK